MNADPVLILHADGASRGNPGLAGAGAVLLDQTGRQVGSFKRFLGVATNNEAEYQALLLGLEGARKLGADRLKIRLDSQLLVRQLNGQYRVKSPGLKPLYEKALRLLRDFAEVDIIHVKRNLNTEADALANQAIDEAVARGEA
ncbi:MAG: ribonuclease HI family protein [Desulfarculaceae bacterium]|jgi:ribonuclease HI